MLRAIITNKGQSWGDREDIQAVLEWDSDVLTNPIWRTLQLAVQSHYRLGDLLEWDLVRVESREDPWHIQKYDRWIVYGEQLAFGQMGDLFPDRCWMSAWRWIGTTCQKIMERSFVNAD